MAFVQQSAELVNLGSGGGGSGTGTVTFPGVTTAGNLVVLVCWNLGGTAVSFTSTAGDDFQVDVTQNSGPGLGVAILSTIATTGTSTYTVDFAGTPAWRCIGLEFSDVEATSYVEAFSSNGGNTSGGDMFAGATGEIDTTRGGPIVAAYNIDRTLASLSGPTGWTGTGTRTTAASTIQGYVNYTVASGASTNERGAAPNSGCNYDAVIVAYKATPAGPVLSAPVGTATGKDAATIGVTLDQSGGTLYRYVSGNASETDSTIKASGTASTPGASGAATFAVTGLTAGVARYAHFIHTVSAVDSNVVSSAVFTPSAMAISGSLSAQSGTAGAAFTWSGSTPSALTSGGIGAKTWAASGLSGSGLTVNTTTGALSGTCGTVGTYSVTWTVTDSSTAGSEFPQTETISGTLTISGTGAATALLISGPSSGAVSVASTNFTVAANGALSSSVTVTPSDSSGGGTFTPSSLLLSSGSTSGTFTYTPASTGTKSITLSNNGGLSNPSAATYTSNAPGVGTLQLVGFKLWTGTLQTSITVPWYKVVDPSTGLVLVEGSSLSVDSSGNSSLSNSLFAIGAPYVVFGGNLDGSKTFKKTVIAS